MLHVFQSDQVEDLVATLVYNLEKSAARWVGVERTFRWQRVVVPNQNLGRYLQFQIAARRGVMANVSFETMETFVESLIPEPGPDEEPVEVVGELGVSRALLGLLSDDALLGEEVMEPVRRFLERAGDEEGIERRRFQLAVRLASIFREYGYSRGEMLERWRRGESVFEGDAALWETEKWQRRLWWRLFGCDGYLAELSEREGRPFLTLTEVPGWFGHFEVSGSGGAREGGEKEGLHFPEHVHVFGFSFLPEFFFRLFSPLRGPEREEIIDLYVMSPCMEVWDDIQSTDPEEEPPWEVSEGSALFSRQESPLALRLWGRPGRDFHRFLIQLTDGDLNQPSEMKRADYTLLQQLQEVIRHRRDVREYAREKREAGRGPRDRKSLRFMACPGVQRECEIIASEIWEMVKTHRELRFNDIAVVVQPRQRGIYQTHLRAAFEQTRGIPHHVIDIDGTRSSPALEAVRLLLALPLGSFRRREFLSLLVHPCVQERFYEGDGTQWMQWCDELNIFHGLDAGDHRGTYLEGSDRYTWDQGIKRVVLGSFMASEPGEEGEVYEGGTGYEYLPLEVGRAGLDGAATLVMVARRLLQEARAARKAKRSLKAWMEGIQEQIGAYIEAVDERDGRALMGLQKKLSDVGAADWRGEAVGYRTAFEFAMQALGSLEEQYGQYLADGVVVSSFRPMRSIPFKVVFVAGLDEGQFPVPEPSDPLDLRNGSRQIGDVRRREQDRYMFLETLMSTRARLYLSWVGRDETSGEVREPASVVRELQEMVAGLEDSERLAKREVVHPLRRYDERYFGAVFGGDCGTQGPAKSGEKGDEADVEDDDDFAKEYWTQGPAKSGENGEEPVIDATGADHILPRSRYHGDGSKFGKEERRWERLWPNHHEEARREVWVVKMRRDLERALKHQGLSGYHPGLQGVRELLGAEKFGSMARMLSFGGPELEGERRFGWEETGRLALRVRDLSRFLDSPIQGSARVLMRIFDDREEDLFEDDDEPFEAEFLERLQIAREVFDRALLTERFDRAELAAELEKVVGREERAGRMPAGLFLEAEKVRCLELVHAWGGNWISCRESEPALKRLSRTVEFRSPGEEEESALSGGREVASLEIPVRVGGREVVVEILGEVQVFGESVAASVQTSVSTKKAELKNVTRAALEEVVLRAAGLSEGPIYAIHLPAKAGEAKDLMWPVGVRTQEEARGYLEGLLSELLSGVHEYFLPVELVDEVLKMWEKEEAVDVYARGLEMRDQDPGSPGYRAPRTAYGPVKAWRSIEPPSTEEAVAMIRRRFGILDSKRKG